MEVVGATDATVGLAIPVFKSAKELRDRIKLVRLLSFSLSERLIILYPCFAGRIGESGTFWQHSPNTKGYQPPQVTL